MSERFNNVESLDRYRSLLGKKSLYELATSQGSNEEFEARKEALRTMIATLKTEYERKEADQLSLVGRRSDSTLDVWNAFDRSTLDDYQKIENLKAELEARAPKKILGPDDNVVSSYYDQAMASYTRYLEAKKVT